jgi:hypothetical protein
LHLQGQSMVEEKTGSSTVVFAAAGYNNTPS